MFRLLFTFLFILLCIKINAQKTFTFERQLSYQKCKGECFCTNLRVSVGIHRKLFATKVTVCCRKR